MSAALGVVIVAFHGSDDLAHCLSSLGTAYPVVVVDNSADPAVRRVTCSAGAQYVDAGANRGFAAGVNLGIAQLPAEVDVLLLNPDAAISSGDIRRLHTELVLDQRLAALSPTLQGLDGQAQRVDWPFPTPGRMWAEALGFGKWLNRRHGFVVGAVLLLRRRALEEVGGFDERFFLYAEETDWQRRAQLNGWHSRVCQGSIAVHRGAGTSQDPRRRAALFFSGQETYIRKWYGTLGWQVYRAGAISGALIRALVVTGDRRRVAIERVVIHCRGPRRFAGMAQ